MKRLVIFLSVLVMAVALQVGTADSLAMLGGESSTWSGASLLAPAYSSSTASIQTWSGLPSLEGDLISKYPGKNVEYKFYDIGGNTYQEALAEAECLGPADLNGSHWVGMTTWGMQWQAKSGGDGRLSAVQVNWHAIVTLPRWTPPTDSDPQDVEMWTKELDLLTSHENGHVDIVASSISGIEDALRSANRSTAQAVFDEAFRQVAAREEQYEVATNHGLQE